MRVAILFALLLVALPTLAADALTGRWKATSALANGKAIDDEEILGSIWSFAPPRLLVHDGKGNDTAYDYVIDGDYLVLQGKGSMKYELGPKGLRVAFFDDLQGKPESFEPRPGSGDPLLIVVRFERLR